MAGSFFGSGVSFGAMPLAFTLDKLGPLARSAADCALVLGGDEGQVAVDASAERERAPEFVAVIILGHVARQRDDKHRLNLWEISNRAARTDRPGRERREADEITNHAVPVPFLPGISLIAFLVVLHTEDMRWKFCKVSTVENELIGWVGDGELAAACAPE